MTKEEFLRNNRGIDNDKDLDPEFMGAMYDRIAQNEIKMKDEDPGQAAKVPPLPPRRRAAL